METKVKGFTSEEVQERLDRGRRRRNPGTDSKNKRKDCAGKSLYTL